jgi:hypothetical protein
MDVKRFLPLSGVAAVAVVVFAVAALGGNTPGNDASGAEVASYYDAHQVREIAAAFLLAASAPLLVIFGASLAAALWPSEAERRPVWELVLLAGSALAAGAFVVVALLTFALADVPAKLGADAPQALNVLDNDAWVAFNSGLGVMMLGAGGSLLARTRLYRRLGWAALALGIALFIPFVDFVALLLSGVWIVVTSVMLCRERAEAQYAVAPRMAS